MHLRSTTCVLDAAIGQLTPEGLEPVMVFPEQGPWQQHLSGIGIRCYIHPFRWPEKSKPVQAIIDFWFWAGVLRKEKIDIIHLNEHDNYPMIRLAAMVMRIPIVVGIRFILEGGFARWAFKGRYRPSRLLFTSTYQLNRSRQELPETIPDSSVILFGNGRDLDELIRPPDRRSVTRAQWQVGERELLLGTASVIRRMKLLEDFILLIKKLRDSGYPVKGIIAGGGRFAEQRYVEELRQQITDNNLERYVTMTGNLEDIRPFYQAVDIYVSTSNIETFGMSVCEAMAFSKPVIAYSGGAVPEVLGDPDWIVDVGDLEALADKAKTLIIDERLRQDLGRKAKARAFANYDAPAIAGKLMGVYKEILN